MKNSLPFIYFLLALLTALPGHAQNGYDYSHKWFNRSLINPAATGNINYFEFTTIGRKQWVGMDGAPGLWLVNAQNLFPDISSGVGLTLSNDYIGFYNALTIKAGYAYHLKLGSEMALSFGLAGGLLTQGRDNTKVDLLNPYDPEYDADARRTYRADFDTGLEFRYKDIRMGFSALHFNASAADATEYSYCRSFNGYASARINIDNLVAIMPVGYVNYANDRFYGEAGAIMYFRASRHDPSLKRLGRVTEDMYDRFWLGMQASFKGSITAMAGLFITEQWRLGYAFGYNPDFQTIHSTTTHELLLAWRIKTSEPRRYLCLEECK